MTIEYMHTKGLCHRDIKPHNILFMRDKWQIKITDFNVSKHFRNTFDKENQFVKMSTHTGTVAFSAPETFTSELYT